MLKFYKKFEEVHGKITVEELITGPKLSFLVIHKVGNVHNFVLPKVANK